MTSFANKRESDKIYDSLIRCEVYEIPIKHEPTILEMTAMHEHHGIIYEMKSGRVVSARLEEQGKRWSFKNFKK